MKERDDAWVKLHNLAKVNPQVSNVGHLAGLNEDQGQPPPQALPTSPVSAVAH